MIDETAINKETKINSKFNLLDLGKNLIKTTNKKIDEKYLIILGDKGSGKSTLFNSLLQTTSTQKETYNPTCGINYSYMRYQPSSMKKHLLNIYEIGGGIKNIGLIKTILNEKTIKNSIIILNLDLSKPSGIIDSIKAFLNELIPIIKEIIDQDSLLDMIEGKRSKYINDKEAKRINIFPLEIIFVANKYDSLEKIDAEKIKWTCRVLRTFSFINGASLLFNKSSDLKLNKLILNLITSTAFNTSDTNVNFSQKNDLLPLYILYYNDSFLEIGDPKVIQQGNRDVILLWEDTFYSIFKKQDENEENDKKGKDEDENKRIFKEPRIDEELKNFE